MRRRSKQVDVEKIVLFGLFVEEQLSLCLQPETTASGSSRALKLLEKYQPSVSELASAWEAVGRGQQTEDWLRIQFIDLATAAWTVSPQNERPSVVERLSPLVGDVLMCASR